MRKLQTAKAVFAALCVLTGLIAIIVGVAVIYWPVALIVAGIPLVYIGAIWIRVDDPNRRRGQ